MQRRFATQGSVVLWLCAVASVGAAQSNLSAPPAPPPSAASPSPAPIAPLPSPSANVAPPPTAAAAPVPEPVAAAPDSYAAAPPAAPTDLPPSAADPNAAITTYEEVHPDSPEVGPTREAGTHCLLGALCLGPVLTAGALDVFGIGAQARTDYWGVGFDYQFVSFTSEGIPVRLSLITVEGRVYPFAGSFFLAGGLAWQHASFKGHVTYQGDSQIPPIDTVLSGRVSVPVLKLGIGFMGRSGFVMGIDLAFGLQLGRTKVDFSSDLPQIQQVVQIEDKIRKRGDTFVRELPFLLQLNLLRFGYLF